MDSVYTETGRFNPGDHVDVDPGFEPPFSATVINVAHSLSSGEPVYRLRPAGGGQTRYAKESWLGKSTEAPAA